MTDRSTGYRSCVRQRTQLDEALHLTGTQHIVSIMQSPMDDPQMAEVAASCVDECVEIFRSAAEQEIEWAAYLFKDGSMIGLNKEILTQYVKYITNQRMRGVGLTPIFENANNNPIPWINSWLSSDNVQVAPQEVEISSYLVGQIDSTMDSADLDDFEL